MNDTMRLPVRLAAVMAWLLLEACAGSPEPVGRRPRVDEPQRPRVERARQQADYERAHGSCEALPAVPPAYGPDAVRHSQDAPEGAPQWYYSVDAPPPYVVAVREAFEPGVRRCLPAGDGQVGPFRVVRADAGVAIEPVPDVELDAEVARCLREQMDAMLPAGVPSAPVTVTLRASMGSIAKARILSVVQAHLGDVRRCYEDMLHFHPQLEGRVTMSFAIGPDGQVGGRSAAADPVYHAADPHSVQQQALVLVGCCIGHVMNDWRFEGRDGDGDILVNYPFAFSASP